MTRAYALGRMQAIRTHIGVRDAQDCELKCSILGLIGTRRSRLPGLLKVRHVRYRAIRRPWPADDSVSHCRVCDIRTAFDRLLGGNAMLEIDPVARRHAQ